MPLPPLAQLLVPRARRRDLVLRAEQAGQIDEIIAAPKDRPLLVLFAGPSGTGKTKAAEAIAAELGLPIHRIDLSQVISKYIGETEKNLKRLFDAADDDGVILFFDEADALFGKRTGVQDSHDRYVNLEVSYLLERIERFNGLAILATNRKSNIDAAYLRRLRLIVDFAPPD